MQKKSEIDKDAIIEEMINGYKAEIYELQNKIYDLEHPELDEIKNKYIDQLNKINETWYRRVNRQNHAWVIACIILSLFCYWIGICGYYGIHLK